MVTKATRPVTRESSACVRERGLRPLIVTLVGSYIELRPKGLRSHETLDLAAAWGLAVKARVAREKFERTTRRKKAAKPTVKARRAL